MDYLQDAMQYSREVVMDPAPAKAKAEELRREQFQALIAEMSARRKARQPLFTVKDKYEPETPPKPAKHYPLHPKCKHPLDGTVHVVSYGDLVRDTNTLAGDGLRSNVGPCRYCTDDNRAIARHNRMQEQLAAFSMTAEVPRYARKFSFTPEPGVSVPFPAHLNQAAREMMEEDTNAVIEAIRNDEEYKGFFLYGAPGAGKSVLAAMIMRRFMEEGFAAYYVLVESYFRHLQATFNKKDLTAEERGYEDNVSRVPVLVIDDMGTESPTEWVLRKIFTLIELRAAAGLMTIITSNDSIEVLAKRWHKKYQDPEMQQMSQRIERRFNDYYDTYFIDSED